MTTIDHANVAAYIELRNIYDGWSIAQMKDGSLVNRWPVGTRRHELTEQEIERMAAGPACP